MLSRVDEQSVSQSVVAMLRVDEQPVNPIQGVLVYSLIDVGVYWNIWRDRNMWILKITFKVSHYCWSAGLLP